MIHKCNIHCHALDINKAELLNLEDRGKWLPFAFDLGIVIAIKQTNDDEDELTYNCTTLFTNTGDSFIIDTPYEEFEAVFESFINSQYEDDTTESNNQNDLTL